MALWSCSWAILRFFSEVFDSWLEAGLRWKGFFLAERLVSPSELVAEAYLGYNLPLRAGPDVSIGSAYYNNIS
jgi:hypothetical protein